MRKKYSVLPIILLTSVSTASISSLFGVNSAAAFPDIPTPSISVPNPLKKGMDLRDKGRRKLEDAGGAAKEQWDKTTKPIRDAEKQFHKETRDAQRKLQEAQKAQRELQQFQNNPTGYVRGKMRRYGVSAGYHRTNKGEIRNNLTRGGWKVIYSKEFGGQEWTKLTACLAGDAFGGAGGCTSAFIKNFVRESYYKTLRGIQNEGVAARKSFRAVLTKKYFVKQMIAAVQGHNIGYPRMNSLEVQFGSATYNRAECLKPEFGGQCAKMPNSHQPYIRYRVK